MENLEVILSIAVVAALVAIAMLYSRIKEKRNLAKAQDGKDLRRLREEIERILPEAASWDVAYAHWEKVERYGRTTRTTYYCYGLAFNDKQLYIIPLTFDEDNDMELHEPMLADSSVLGIVSHYTLSDKKTGEIKRITATFHDKNGKELLTLYVDTANTREDRFHHVNIVQPKECRHFDQFIRSLSGQVSEENADLPERVASEAAAKNNRTAIILGVIGIFFSVIPAAGILLGILGLIFASKAAQQRSILSLVLPVLALAAGLLFFFAGFLI